MIPAQAATQKMRRPATCRSYSGLRTRSWRMAKAITAASAIDTSPITRVVLSGTGAKLIARISAETKTTERMPPRLSTGLSVSLTWAGT